MKESTLSPLENFPETPRILPFFHNSAYDDERGGDDDNDQTDSIDATTGSENHISNIRDARQSGPSFPPSRKLHPERLLVAPHTGFLGISIVIRHPHPTTS